MTRDEAASLLTERGVLPTAQRIDIALLTLARPQHLSAEQIISAIRSNELKISKATVYNTLNLFCAQGLLRTVDVDPTRPLAFALVTNTDKPLAKGVVRRAHEQLLGEVCKYLAKTTKAPTAPAATPQHVPAGPPPTGEEPETEPDEALDAETAGAS